MISVNTAYDKKAQDRILALADLVTLMETLPVAREISFSDTYDDHLRLGLASTAEFDAWAKHLGALVTYRDHRHGDTVQCHGYASWSGWSLYVGTCVRDPEPEPAAVMPAGSVLPSQADGTLDFDPTVAAGLRELEKAELDGAAVELKRWESLPALTPADVAELRDEPVRISDERVAEIRAEANSRYFGDTPNEDGPYIRTLPELDPESIPLRGNSFTSFRLVDGTVFTWSRPQLGWEVAP